MDQRAQAILDEIAKTDPIRAESVRQVLERGSDPVKPFREGLYVFMCLAFDAGRNFQHDVECGFDMLPVLR